MAVLPNETVRKFDIALVLLKQLRDNGGISPNLPGVYLSVGRTVSSFIDEAVIEVEELFNTNP